MPRQPWLGQHLWPGLTWAERRQVSTLYSLRAFLWGFCLLLLQLLSPTRLGHLHLLSWVVPSWARPARVEGFDVGRLQGAAGRMGGCSSLEGAEGPCLVPDGHKQSNWTSHHPSHLPSCSRPGFLNLCWPLPCLFPLISGPAVGGHPPLQPPRAGFGRLRPASPWEGWAGGFGAGGH